MRTEILTLFQPMRFFVIGAFPEFEIVTFKTDGMCWVLRNV